VVIRSFADKDTERLWRRQRVKQFESVERTARRKTGDGERRRDLAVPPGNRLEPLYGDRIGQHSIRVNDQWRICFRWSEAGPDDVEICDYH
jgi:proteic killer suppression protein